MLNMVSELLGSSESEGSVFGVDLRLDRHRGIPSRAGRWFPARFVAKETERPSAVVRAKEGGS